MRKQMTQSEVNKKYKGKYIKFDSYYDHSKKEWVYTVTSVHDKIKENTTLGQDVGTPLEYCR